MDWQEYQREVAEELRSCYPDATITHDTYLPGRYSGIGRQVDTLVEQELAGSTVRLVVETKFHTRPIDVKDVESFLGFLADVAATQGMMVSSQGYSKAAQLRAHADPAGLEFDVLSLTELKLLQSVGAIPYAGTAAVLIRAPFGWLVDAKRRPSMLAALYPRGLTLEEAQSGWEWGYVQIWNKDEDAADLDSLCNLHDSEIVREVEGAEISYLPGVSRPSAPSRIRRLVTPRYAGVELTGYIQFDRFLFFCVVFTPFIREALNTRKLRSILRIATPGTVSRETAG